MSKVTSSLRFRIGRRYNDGVKRIASLIVLALTLTGCASTPESNAPLVQKENGPAPATKQVIAMGDPNANAYFVKDISGGKDTGGWRWTFDRPELRFLIRKTEGVHAVADFSIAGDTIKVTGPVTVSFFVNNTLIGKEKYTKPGDYHFDKPVPPGLLTVDKTATFAMESRPIFVSKGDGQHLGLILVRAGFVS